MTDFERIKAFYDFLKEEYKIERADEVDNFYQFYRGDKSDFNQRIIVRREEDLYGIIYEFKDEELFNWYITE